MDNLILQCDSYKASHYLQFPPHTSSMYSYAESRGGEYPETVFFGLQYFIKKYLTKPISLSDINEANDFFAAHGEPFNLQGWLGILRNHGGMIPLRIRAVKEGTAVPVRNVLMDVESTDPDYFWVTTWFETALLRAIWYPTTVATQSYYCRKTILDFLINTADNPYEEIPFKLHDFGARGVSSHESAAIGGAAHLVNFMGSDTIEGIICARRYYKEPMAAFSVPATEHSTMTSWRHAGETNAFANALDQFAGFNIVSVVSDSYNLWNAIDETWAHDLRERVEGRTREGKLTVVRLDSGDPVTVVAEAIRRLDNAFGSEKNSKGFRVLNGVRVLQGDGINRQSIYEILAAVTNAGYSAANVVFGMGGALLQQVNRDTQKFAFKCSSIIVDGTRRDIFKQPIDDPMKRSKKGRLDLVHRQGIYRTVEYGAPDTLLEPVYEDGRLLRDQSLAEIRNLAAKTSNRVVADA